MRAALWLLTLFGVAVAAALFAGNNQGTVTLYWPPYRIDLSLNMVVLLLVGGFVTVYAALRALAALLALPHQARRWRVQQKERAMHGALLDAELLADVYINLTRGQDALLIADDGHDSADGVKVAAIDLRGLALPVLRASEQEQAAHAEVLTQIDKASGGKTIWRTLQSA